MKLLINYANEIYQISQKRCNKTGKKIGLFDKVISYGPKDIDSDFYNQNKKILCQKRGNGYWLWKPYFIKKSLNLIGHGDYLFYCDSGAYFINSIKPLIEIMVKVDRDLIPFDLRYIEKCYTKRDAFILMNCDSQEFADTRQRLASFILLRKSDFTIDFMNEFLSYAQDERLITDLENQMGCPNDPSFIEHRHDQSIFSLLTKKYKLDAYRDPSQFGNQMKDQYPNSPYDQLIHHTRERRLPIFKRIRQKIKALSGF